MTRAVNELTAALAAAFLPGGSLGGYGFALWCVPLDGQGTAPLLSNVPRERVAEAVGAWLVAHNFAVALPVSPPPKTN